ncbi:MAG: hypothetical protein ABEK04_05945 [Candidatus Nanohalobium sp.]
MLEDVAVIAGLLVTAYLVQQFEELWVGEEYKSATFLKLNKEKATAVFSLAFLGSISVFAGAVFTGLDYSGLNGLAFDAALVFYMLFFLLLNRLVRGGDVFWGLG